MLLKTFILLVLSVLAFAYPQDEAVDHPDVNVDEIQNRVSFLGKYEHTPATGVKEGDVLTITYGPPKAEDAELAAQLVKSFTIAIGTGSDTMVDDQFFMESERLPIPTAETTYKFQLPAQMENKQYCIVYTPYSSETGPEKALYTDGRQLESLYETWFFIKGSLQPGAGQPQAANTFDNSAATAAGTGAAASGQINNVDQAARTDPTQGANAQSGSITISPAITAFIAVLFACFFI